MKKTVVIGIGNRDRGDDAAGPVAAEKLSRLPNRLFDVIENDGDVTKLVDCLGIYDDVIIVDAVQSVAVGKVTTWNVSTGWLSAAGTKRPFELSGHLFGLKYAIELARALGRFPRRVTVYGVHASQFEFFRPMTAEVVSGVDRVVDLIRAMVGSR